MWIRNQNKDKLIFAEKVEVTLNRVYVNGEVVGVYKDNEIALEEFFAIERSILIMRTIHQMPGENYEG